MSERIQDLAEIRTQLASERTMLAYVRTALAIIAFGVALNVNFVIVVVIGGIFLAVGVLRSRNPAR